MPKVRRNPKAFKSGRRVYKKSATRSTSYRKRVLTLKGTGVSVRKAKETVKFDRKVPTLYMCSNLGGVVPTIGIKADDTTSAASIPISLGGINADTCGTADVYQFGGAMEFKLSDVTEFADFTNLFDQYSIQQVDMVITDLHNVATESQAGQVRPTIKYVVDCDDATVPAAAQTVNAYQNVKSWTFRGDGQPLRISIKPRVATTVYRTGITSAYGPAKEGMLLDVDNVDVPHYGLKMWFQDCFFSGTSSQIGKTKLRFELTYRLKFNAPK